MVRKHFADKINSSLEELERSSGMSGEKYESDKAFLTDLLKKYSD